MPLFVRPTLPLVMLLLVALPVAAQETPPAAEQDNKPAEAQATPPAAEQGNKPAAAQGTPPAAEQGNKSEEAQETPPAAEQDNKPAEAQPTPPAAEQGNKPEEAQPTPPAAEQGNKPEEAQETPPAAEPGPKEAEYVKLFSQWRELLGELRDLRNEYPDANDDRKKVVESRYDELVQQGDTMKDSLVEAAVAAYEESPGTDPDVPPFLMGVLYWQIGGDDFENAFELGQKMLDSGFQDDGIHPLIGLAALVVNEFDVSEKHLKLAEEKNAFGLLEQLGEEHPFSKLGEFHGEFTSYYRDAWSKETKIREAEAKADDLPRVLITTDHGPIEVELFENEAPNAVANFISLVKNGFYDGLTFHRVLPGFMAQGGCPEGTGTGGPGYTIPCECYEPNHRIHFRGTLSMAHAGRDTGGSQFFLTFVPTRQLDGRHTAFGRVVKGFDVLAKIRRRDPEEGGKAEKIVKMEVLRDRGHEYEPKKVP